MQNPQTPSKQLTDLRLRLIANDSQNDIYHHWSVPTTSWYDDLHFHTGLELRSPGCPAFV